MNGPRRASADFHSSRGTGDKPLIIAPNSPTDSQSLDDPVVLNAVDDIEDLTTELSQKIWQKITLLDLLKSADDRAAQG